MCLVSGFVSLLMRVDMVSFFLGGDGGGCNRFFLGFMEMMRFCE